MDLSSKILALIEPTIEPHEIQADSRGEEEGEVDKLTKTTGIDSPVIFMNDYIFEKNDVVSFSLSNADKMPTVTATIIDSKNAFAIDAFPRDGDYFTVFINSKNESTFKAIHLDFELTSINTNFSKAGDSKKVSISGRVKVHKMFSENCQSLSSDNSLEHLTQVVQELGLGLASNIDSTADEQIRIQPFTSYYDFIRDIVDSSYISDDSFQDYFIDPYYYLNYVDVNKIINSPNPPLSEFEDSFNSANVSITEESYADDGLDSTLTKLLLTNNIQFKSQNQYINKYEIVNSSKTVIDRHGHFRDIQIYDDNSDSKLDEFRLEALSTDPANLKDIEEPLKGSRESEEYLDLVKHKYIGRQDVGEGELGNVHANHVFAHLNNVRNQEELDKLKLVVTLESFNPSLYRFQKVPVLMYHTDKKSINTALSVDEVKKEAGFTDAAIDVDNNPDEPVENPDQVLDQFLSGYYLVESIDVIYKQKAGTFYQKVTLLRRDWPARIAAINSNT